MLKRVLIVVAVVLASCVVIAGTGIYLFVGVENSVAFVQRQLAAQSLKGGPELVLEVDLDALRRKKHEQLRQDVVNLLRSRQLTANARVADAGVEVSTKL